MGKFQIKLVRKPFRRNISLYVKPPAEIRVVTSQTTSLQQVQKFVELKESWIESHLLKFKNYKDKFPEKKILQSETFPFLGENLELRFVVTPLKNIFFSQADRFLNLHVPESLWNELKDEDLSEHREALKKFYKREAEKLISERAKLWSAQMDLHPKSLKFKNQKTRWGSCSNRGGVNINWRLIAAPLEIIDYILIHEFCHLEHMNHSQDFWALVGQHAPGYQKAEQWLDTHGRTLDFLL